MPFLTPIPKSNPRHPVFAGLDDPFNFPRAKMRYTSRSPSPASTSVSVSDSGYGSFDEGLNPKTKAEAEGMLRRRALGRDKKGRWGVCNVAYEWQSDGDGGEGELGLGSAGWEGGAWMEAGRTFMAICNERPGKPSARPLAREKWYSTRLYARSLQQRDRNEGLTELQRSMAPVLRRASRSLSLEEGRTEEKSPPRCTREGRALLHPSFPAAPGSAERASDSHSSASPSTHPKPARSRTPSTLLHPSAPFSPSSSLGRTTEQKPERTTAPTPLGLRTSSAQPARTLGIKIDVRKVSAGSVLCSSPSSEAGDDGSDGGESRRAGGEEDGDGSGVRRGEEVELVCSASLCSVSLCEESAGATYGESGGVLARTALVAKAQRVKVRSPGLKKGVSGVGI